jgi:pyruvate dehydrogenase E1 component
MIPFFIFYSMFGFQRDGDLAWAAGDQRARGFLLGATAGRTTLLGEGLQHQDGQSLLYASAYPNVVAYDASFAYEVATIVQDGIRRMLGTGDDVVYYLTLYNENYPMPAMPDGVHDDLLRGLYRFGGAPEGVDPSATILFSGPMWQAATAARAELAEHYATGVELWAATSYKSLRQEALATERWNRLHPFEPWRTPFVTRQLEQAPGPYVAVSDFMRAVPDQISRWVPGRYSSLGTDGYGRSDTREQLRRHFEVDTGHLVVAVLSSLMAEGKATAEQVKDAIARYGVDPEARVPQWA